MVDKGKLSKLSFSKLIELKKVCFEILERYQNELSTYSRIHNDPKFEMIGVNEKNKLAKTHVMTKLLGEINMLIEENVISTYVKED